MSFAEPLSDSFLTLDGGIGGSTLCCPSCGLPLLLIPDEIPYPGAKPEPDPELFPWMGEVIKGTNKRRYKKRMRHIRSKWDIQAGEIAICSRLKYCDPRLNESVLHVGFSTTCWISVICNK